jgi:hypothetical protein
MFEKYDPLARVQDNSKARITVCLNQNEGGEDQEDGDAVSVL